MADKSPPVISKWYGQPYSSWYYPDPECEGEDCQTFWSEWITTETQINWAAVEDTNNAAGLREVKYRMSQVDDRYCQIAEKEEYNCQDAEGSGEWTTVETHQGSFYATEESCHLIEIFAVDNVDKNALHKQCVYVEEHGPDPVKIVGEPKEPWDEIGRASCRERV